MLFKIIAIGELKSWTKLAFEDYAKRIQSPYSVKTIQIPTPKRAKNQSGDACIALETKKIEKHIKNDDYVITLDQHGKSLSTEQLAQKLDLITSNKCVTFILGGPDGLGQKILERAQFSLSLSAMVLPHALARVVLIEQIYRQYTLATNHPYHRE